MAKKEPATQETTQPSAKSHHWIPLALGSSLLLLLIIGSVYYLISTRDPDCAALSKEATSLMKKKDYKIAYANLQPHSEACGGPKSKLVTDNKDRLEYDYKLAVSAYQSGHKDEAKDAAKQGLEVSKQMNKGIPSEDKDQQNLAFDLISLSEGQYYNYRNF